MPRNDGKNPAVEFAVDDVDIGATHGASGDAEEHLASVWPRRRALHGGQRRAAAGQDHSPVRGRGVGRHRPR